MDPEVVLVIVAAALFGVVVWLVALPAGRAPRHPFDSEPLAWWRLVHPLFGGSLVCAFLWGWALQEPNPADEHVGLAFQLLAMLAAGIMVRALLRSARALRASSTAGVAIGTIGFRSPRVFVSEEFRRSVSDRVLAAALAHEAAHVKGRDPLRIWLAQMFADLQWPIPGTSRRFSAWLLAVEAQRDDEAIASGTAAPDLAKGILTAARLQLGSAPRLSAQVTGAGEGIAWRVRRLLGPRASSGVHAPSRTSWFVRTSSLALLLGAVWLGNSYGDGLLGVLPGVTR
jgi:Zn-dependent protease with chaperone function